jgi:hypothetical protein
VSDDTQMESTPAPQVPPQTPAGPAAGGGFFSTAVGRAVLIGGAVIILLAIVGVVVFSVLGASLFGTGTPTSTQNVPTGVPTASTPASSAVASTSVPAVPAITNRDVFTPRDPFLPIAAPTLSSSGVTSESGDNDDALTLSDIVTNNGVRQAVFHYENHTYTVGNGDTVDSSSWKVIKVNSSSVVMEFGDQQVTFSPGEGITK